MIEKESYVTFVLCFFIRGRSVGRSVICGVDGQVKK